MNDAVIFIIIVLFLAAYFIFYKDLNQESQNYDIPQEYKGVEGLDYIRQNYASGLSQAKSLCTSQFSGEWRDSSNTIGCYNMKGFSTSYCGLDLIKNLVNLCNSIGGNPVCSSTQASCSV